MMQLPRDIGQVLLGLLLVGGGCTPRPPPAGPEAEAPVVEAPVVEEPVAGVVQTEARDLRPYIVSARASSVDGRRAPAEYAFDGNPETRWTSTWTDDEWVEGHFDRPVRIEELVITWEAARAAAYDVLVSPDGQTWQAVATVEAPAGRLQDRVVLDETRACRAVRVHCLSRATEWGNSIFEVVPVGWAEGAPPDENLSSFEVPPTPWEKEQRATARRLLEQAAQDPPSTDLMTDDAFLELVSRRSFDYFWWETNPENGLTRDRGRNFGSSEECTLSSVAAVGFALSAYVIGAEREWVTREAALERTRRTLRTFAHGPVQHVKGFFSHFVDYFTGERTPNSEISTIDTALLLAGMITAMEYFGDPEVTQLGETIFERVDWNWARYEHANWVSHGLDGNNDFITWYWGTMSEGILIYLLGMGSREHPLPATAWKSLHRERGSYRGYEYFVETPYQSIFRYLYPALWFDFRARRDMLGYDHFQDVREAALGMRAYCIAQAARFPESYGPDAWGLGAADGPGNAYIIFGFPPGNPGNTDGTVVPYAMGGTMCFIPQHALRAMKKLYNEHRDAWGKYGFADSVNDELDFVARDALGLDAGTILLGIENYRSGLIWKLFMRNRWVKEAARRIGWKRYPHPAHPAGPVDLEWAGSWKMLPGDAADRSMRDLDDTTWEQAALPDFWEHRGGAWAGRDGVVWYRCTFGLDGDRLRRWQALRRPVFLRLGAIDDLDRTFVNGRPVGETMGGEDPARLNRAYEIPLPLLAPGRNVIAVRVEDRGGAGGIWRGPLMLGP